MNPIKLLKARLMLDKAIKMADEAHAKTSERYYVMPSMDGKLVVMNRQDLKILKRKGYIVKGATVEYIAREAFYFTPYRNGDQAMSPEDEKDRRKLFYFWQAAMAEQEKERRKLKRKNRWFAMVDKVKLFFIRLFDK